MIKYIFFLLISLNILGNYQFSKILPKKTQIYFAINNPKELIEEFKKTPLAKLFMGDNYKTLKEKIDQSFKTCFKIPILPPALSPVTIFEEFISTPIALSYSFSNSDDGYSAQSAFLFKNSKLYEKLNSLLMFVSKLDRFKDNYQFLTEKSGSYQFSIIKKMDQKNNIIAVYTKIDDIVIVANSIEYLKVIIKNIKNSSIPKMAQNKNFYRYKKIYPNSNLEFFIDINSILKTISKIEAVNKTFNLLKDYIDVYDFVSAFATVSIENKEIKSKLQLSTKKQPEGLRQLFLSNKTVLSIPNFIPASSYSVSTFQMNLSNFYKYIITKIPKEQLAGIKKLELMLGITLEDAIFNNLGPNYYIVSSERKNKNRDVFIADLKDYKKFTMIIGSLSSFNPELKIKMDKYLGGTILRIKNEPKYIIGFKSGKVLVGNKVSVQELMQSMGENNKQFVKTDLYRKLIKNKTTSLIFMRFSNAAYESYYSLRNSDSLFFNDSNKKGSYKSHKRDGNFGNKLFKLLQKHFKKVKKEDWVKYLGYSFSEISHEGNEIIFSSTLYPPEN